MALLEGQGQPMSLTWTQPVSSINSDATEAVINITAEQQTFCFTDVTSQPIPSLLRQFSAPIKLDYPYTQQQLLFLAEHENDGFNRWEAVQRLLLQALQEVMQGAKPEVAVDKKLLALLADLLTDTHLDPALVARLVLLPSEAYLAEMQTKVDVDKIYHSRESVRAYLAQQLETELVSCYKRCQDNGPFAQDGIAIGRRALKNACLLYLTTHNNAYLQLAQAQYDAQGNLTDVNAALQAIVAMDEQAADKVLTDFYGRWQQDAQVVDQWFALQAGVNKPGHLDKVQALMSHPAFDIKNPNKVRSVLGSFMRSAINFHALDGSGYAFIAQQIIVLNAINPMMAATLSKPLGRFKKHTPERQSLIRQQLQLILDSKPSKDVYEVVSKALAQ